MGKCKANLKKRWIYGIAIVVVIVAIVIFNASGDDTSVDITTVVEQGGFDVVVYITSFVVL